MSFLLSNPLKAQVIPDNRTVNWGVAGKNDSITVKPDSLNILDLGGAGDSATFNDTALSNAIDSLNGNYGVIHFPSGDFLFQSSIILNDSIILKGI
ncbi:MAG: glycosyl hydrolase family 28-related protein [Flavobacteriales bacterium]